MWLRLSFLSTLKEKINEMLSSQALFSPKINKLSSSNAGGLELSSKPYTDHSGQFHCLMCPNNSMSSTDKTLIF